MQGQLWNGRGIPALLRAWARTIRLALQGSGLVFSPRRGCSQRSRRCLIEALDVTEIEQALQELREAKRMLATARRISNLGCWEWNVRSDRVSWSVETCRIFGLAPGEFDGTYASFLEMVVPQDRAAVQDVVNAAFAGMPRYSYRYRLTRPDGTLRLVEGEGACQFDEAGRLLRLVGTVIDNTDREAERQALRDSEARFRCLAALSSDFAGLGATATW